MKDITLINKDAYSYISTEECQNNAINEVPFLPLNRLNSPSELVDCKELISELVSTGCFTSGPYINKVENKLREFYQTDYCIATSSGTDALKIALKAIGVGFGDEVILPLNSFAATENAVMAVGGIPIFANIDESFNMIPLEVERLKTSKTKAILPVCLYGSIKNIRKTYQISKNLGLPVVVDAAQCFGIQDIINFCDIMALSFNPFKNIGTFGKSGALLTKSKAISTYARQFSYHGFEEGKKNLKAQNWGFNSRMDNMQAAILIKKLNYFEDNAFKRAILASNYINKMNNLDEHINLPAKDLENTWHLFPVLLKEQRRNNLIKFAKSRGVELDIYYPYLSHQGNHPLARDYPCKDQFVNSEDIHARLIHLPLYNHMTKNEQHRVIGVIHEFFK